VTVVVGTVTVGVGEETGVGSGDVFDDAPVLMVETPVSDGANVEEEEEASEIIVVEEDEMPVPSCAEVEEEDRTPVPKDVEVLPTNVVEEVLVNEAPVESKTEAWHAGASRNSSERKDAIVGYES